MKVYYLKNIADDQEAVIRCKEGFRSDAELRQYVLKKELFGEGADNLQLETRELEIEEYLRYMIDKIIAGIDEKLEDMKYELLNADFDEMTVEEIDHECRCFIAVHSIRKVFKEEQCVRFSCEVLEHWLMNTSDMIDKLSETIFDMSCSDESIVIYDLINQGWEE